jgi:hypothetical protein
VTTEDDAAAADKSFSAFPQGMADSSASGSFLRGVATGAAPAVGGLAGAGIGAEAGGAATLAGGPIGGAAAGGIAGATLGGMVGENLGYPKTGAAIGGALGGVAGAFGGAPIVGGFAGAFGGGATMQRGQDWLISELPQEWQDKYNEQMQADTAQHGGARYMGGLAPYALTMSPRVAAKEHPDVLEAKAQYEALYERWCELAKRVATTPAKTAEGLISKITLIASRYSEDDLDGTYDGILASAALDAQALTSAKIEEARS